MSATQAPLLEGIHCGDALNLIPRLKDRSVNLCLTSPPYAEQRKAHYPSIPEAEYPAWLCRVMEALQPKLAADASVLIVIRAHVRNGAISDYVLRTRLALQEQGWLECEELIWSKPDAPPLGSKQRPRRTWEHVLWYSLTPKPFVDLRAAGPFSDRLGFSPSLRQRIEAPWSGSRNLKVGAARISDQFVSPVSDHDEGVHHPAMFPVSLCEKLIRTFSREGDLVVDPFAGSGTVLLAGKNTSRCVVSFEVDPEYVEMAKGRLAEVNGPAAARLHVVSGNAVRFVPEFPAKPRLRRALFSEMGLNESDLRIFEHVAKLTVLSAAHCPSTAISVNDIADRCGVSRSTAIRSLKRLTEAALLVTVQNPDWNRHRPSDVGIAPRLIQEVSTSVSRTSNDTRRRGLPLGLHNCDLFDGMPRLEPHSVQLLLTDLPTGATANDWDVPVDLDALWVEIERVLRPNGAAVMFAHFPFDKTLATSNMKCLKHEFIWEKSKPTSFMHAQDGPLRSHETILVFSPSVPLYHPQMEPSETTAKVKKSAKRSQNYFGADRPVVHVTGGLQHPRTILRFAGEHMPVHRTQKPVPLLEFLIRSYTNPGDIVCDPCAGSGSTGIAAMNASRLFVGFERDRNVFQTAALRLKEHDVSKASNVG